MSNAPKTDAESERDRYAFIFGHVFTPALPPFNKTGCLACTLPESDPIHHQHDSPAEGVKS